MAQALIRRCFEALRIPFSMTMADGLQILRYEEGQAYISHRDWFSVGVAGDDLNFDSEMGGSNRYATVFLYLSPPPSGGWTVFPKGTLEGGVEDSMFVSTGRNKTALEEAMKVAESHFKPGWEVNLTQECYSRLAVKPVRLGAALFYHQDPMTGRLLPEAEHGACPSMTGTKWGANLWIWNKARHLSKPKGDTSSAPEACKVEFVNSEAEAVDVQYSIDDGLTWTHFTTIETRKTFGATSYGGHSWRFTRSGGGEALRTVTVPEDVRSVRFTSSPEKGEEL